MQQDAIVAISTAPGRAAIGIVRLSGPSLEKIVPRVFRPGRQDVRLRDRRPHFGNMLDENGEPVDEGLLLWMTAPSSYTGEDVVELHCHGNPLILEKLVFSAIAAGARSAEPGEFTRRAYLNGRLDLIQADAVIQLINSTSETSLKAARRLLAGELSARITSVRAQIVSALKWLELAIDFPEENSEFGSEDAVFNALMQSLEEIRELTDSFEQGRRARQGAEVVLCGRVNVGKSSLFNRLVGYRRAIVTSIPGTTRDLVEATVQLGGICVRLEDTAGLRDSDDPIEGEGIELAREAIARADLVLLVVDGSKTICEEEETIVGMLEHARVEWLGVANKMDLGRLFTRSCAKGVWLETSALTGEGVADLLDEISRRLIGSDRADQLLLCARWQKEILERVGENLEKGVHALKAGLSPEAGALELYEALDRLDEIQGGNGREEVIERVFAEFCLGK